MSRSNRKGKRNQQKAQPVTKETPTSEEQLEQDALEAALAQGASEEPQQEETSVAGEHFGEEDDVEQEAEEQDDAQQDAPEEENPGEEPLVEQEEPPVENPPVEEDPADDDAEEEPAKVNTEPAAIANIRANLQDYADQMGAATINTLPTILIRQRTLANTISAAFTADVEHQRDAVNLVYAAFRENTNGAFSQRMVFRGVRELAATDARRAHVLRSALTIILNTLDGSRREETLQHMDFNPLLDEIPDKEVRAGIITYLGLG